MDWNIIASNIDTMRKLNKWSLQETARRMGIAYGTVFSHIHGGSMTLEHLVKYSEIFGCNLSDLVEGVVDRKKFVLVPNDLADYYPYNLAMALYGIPPGDACIYQIADNYDDIQQAYLCDDTMQKMSRIYLPGLMQALNQLPKRERKVIELRYMSRMSLAQCAKELGVAKETVRKAENNAVSTLCSEPMAKFYTITTPREVEILNLRIHMLQKELDKLHTGKSEDVETGVVAHRNTMMPIRLLGFSNRTCHCLQKAGINYLYQLDGISRRKIARLHGLGTKCMNEIESAMQEYDLYFKV